MLIVFEGADGVGKTTLATMVANWYRLSGKSVVQFAFPDTTTYLGHFIARVLRGDLAMDTGTLQLLFAANRRECLEKIRTAMIDNIVIVDRYMYSGYAYGGNLDYDAGMPIPDYTFYIYRDQLKTDGDLFENETQQTTVIERYQKIMHLMIPVKSSGEAFDEIRSHLSQK